MARDIWIDAGWERSRGDAGWGGFGYSLKHTCRVLSYMHNGPKDASGYIHTLEVQSQDYIKDDMGGRFGEITGLLNITGEETPSPTIGTAYLI